MELNSLRNATQNQHEKIEQQLDLLRPSFARGDYLALLRSFYGFVQPWEHAVEPLLEPELPGFFELRRKLPNIAADLRYFGSTADDLACIASCKQLPVLKNIGAALGSMYVIEGSSLGGAILSRHFATHLGVLPDAGCRFFSGYGDRTGRMWSAFGQLIGSRPPAENNDMLEASVMTFDILSAWFRSETHA